MPRTLLADIKSVLCVPFYNKYETLGCMVFLNRRDGKCFSGEDADICEIMAMLAAIAIDENNLNLGTFVRFCSVRVFMKSTLGGSACRCIRRRLSII